MTNKSLSTLTIPPCEDAKVLSEVRQNHQTHDALNTQNDRLNVRQATVDRKEELRNGEPTVSVNEKLTVRTRPVMTSDHGPRYLLGKHKILIRFILNALTRSRDEDVPTVLEGLSGPDAENGTDVMRP